MKNIQDLNAQEKRLYALEALLKRVSLVGMPFVLKGSLLTRQFLDNPDMRAVEDIDFLYAGKVENSGDAEELFTDWMIRATELDLEDGVVFESFRRNEYWENIDYAMSEDFPTAGTDLAYRFEDDESWQEVHLDVSFELEMEIEPVPLEYASAFFGSFLVPYTAPLSIQVAWKLHQTIVRPRFKDLHDLQFLLSHSSYDSGALAETLQAVVNECSFDRSIIQSDIHRVLAGDLNDLLPLLYHDRDLAKCAGDENRSLYFVQFAADLRKTMDAAGINQTAFENLPQPKRKF